MGREIDYNTFRWDFCKLQIFIHQHVGIHRTQKQEEDNF